MRIIKNTFIYILLVFCILSCNGKKNSINYKKDITLTKCEFLQIKELIGSPYDIVKKDSLLIYYDRYDGQFLSVFDVKNNRFVGRFLSEGNGPGEAIAPIYLLPFSENDKLYLYQRNLGTLSMLDISNFQISNNIQITSENSWRPFEMQRTKDYFISLGIYENGRFGIYDLNGAIINEVGEYPFKGKDMENSEAFLIYQGPYCANPTYNYFASGCLYCDHISFYEVKDNDIVMVKEHSSFDANVVCNNNHVVPKNESIINYTYAFASKSYCYMLFSGKTYKENQNETSGGKYIIMFDWNGNYIKTYQTDHEIYNFYVDEINLIIYATAQYKNGEKGIAKIKL